MTPMEAKIYASAFALAFSKEEDLRKAAMVAWRTVDAYRIAVSLYPTESGLALARDYRG